MDGKGSHEATTPCTSTPHFHPLTPFFDKATDFILLNEEGLPKGGHSGTDTRDVLHVNAALGSGALKAASGGGERCRWR